MEGNARAWFTPKQKAELWERWKSGQCVADIARAEGTTGQSEHRHHQPNSVGQQHAQHAALLLLMLEAAHADLVSPSA